MAYTSITNTELNATLLSLIESGDIVPGAQVGYELCKQLWISHPLGGKLVEKPIKMALNKARALSIDVNPKDMLLKAFTDEWKRLGVTTHIRDVMFLSRAYGAAAIVMGAPNIPTNEPIDPWKLPDLELYFNQLDPLNTAGSIVTNQNPNAPDFQKPLPFITAAGQPYHPSRAQVIFNGTPIYLAFTASAFGFAGRSVFQRCLFPMKSFIQSMITDDLVTFKAGLIIAKMKQAGSIVNRIMEAASRIKRDFIKQGGTGNVITIDPDEDIETLDMTHTDTAMTTARDNIIANIAAGSDVPAILLKDEAFAKGFGEGVEDSKAIVQYVDGLRTGMDPLFAFFDNIVQHRAWNRQFFDAVKSAHPDLYKDKSYEQAFYMWQRGFAAVWPNLMEETEAEKAKTADTKIKGITDVAQTLLPIADPGNRAKIVMWMADNLNEIPDTFKSDLVLDYDALEDFEPPETALTTPKVPKPATGD